jgi:hypothetical protein
MDQSPSQASERAGMGVQLPEHHKVVAHIFCMEICSGGMTWASVGAREIAKDDDASAARMTCTGKLPDVVVIKFSPFLDVASCKYVYASIFTLTQEGQVHFHGSCDLNQLFVPGAIGRVRQIQTRQKTSSTFVVAIEARSIIDMWRGECIEPAWMPNAIIVIIMTMHIFIVVVVGKLESK